MLVGYVLKCPRLPWKLEIRMYEVRWVHFKLRADLMLR